MRTHCYLCHSSCPCLGTKQWYLVRRRSTGKNTQTYTPLLIIWSLDQVKEDVEELVSLFRLWVKAGGTQDEWDQLLKEK